ncbi:MAG: hypothetical protein Q4C03_04215 [bacterium]|nr:hypothetical protein [bacterium]
MSNVTPPAKTPPSPYVWQRHTFAGARWPKRRMTRSFFLIVPWIDCMAVAFFLFLIFHGTMIQPGRMADISSVALEEGLLAKHPTAVIRRLIAPNRPNVTILFFDDARYTSDQPTELEALTLVRIQDEINLIIEDETIAHGEIIRWKEYLRGCGVTHINEVMPPANDR